MSSNGPGLSDKARAMLAGVVPKPAPAAPKKARSGPTPEQERHGDYVRGSAKTAHGQVNSVAYRRRPKFETLAKAKGSDIDRAGLEAMRFYRDSHEEAARSLTRCALDVQAAGGGMPSCLPPGLSNVPLEWLAAGATVPQELERAIGNVVSTMRAVVLEDMSFSDVAIARFGSRRQSWLETEKQRGRTKRGGKMVFVEKIVPKSGRHREIVRQEFTLGLRRLTKAHQLMTSTAKQARKGRMQEPSLAELTQPPAVQAAPAEPLPSIDPIYLDESGRMKPWAEIADIIRASLLDDPAEPAA